MPVSLRFTYEAVQMFVLIESGDEKEENSYSRSVSLHKN